jgi:uncharacterized protein
MDTLARPRSRSHVPEPLVDRGSDLGRLWPFFVLAFALSWLLWVPSLAGGRLATPFQLAGAFGPALAASALVLRRGGWAEVRRLLAALRPGRVAAGRYAVALAGPPAVLAGALGAHLALGGTVVGLVDPAHPDLPGLPGGLLAVPLVFGWVLLLSVVGEELGWRGYALPRLLARCTPLTASLALGAAWAAWHLPLMLHPAALQHRVPAAWFVLQILGQSVLLTWLYERTRGSVLLPALLHAAANTSVGLLPVLPLDSGGSARPLWLALVALYLLAAVVVVRTGMHHRTPATRERDSS